MQNSDVGRNSVSYSLKEKILLKESPLFHGAPSILKEKKIVYDATKFTEYIEPPVPAYLTVIVYGEPVCIQIMK